MVQSIGEILQQWAELDIFFYALPFLLIFALVFAILQKLNLAGGDVSKNKGINAIIALTIALLSLQFDYVSRFFQIIFPKLGIGLAVLLVALIMMGLFVNPKKQATPIWIFFGIGGIVSIVILLGSFTDYSWWTGGFWQENISAIIAGIIIIVFVVIIIGSGKSTPPYGTDPFRIIPAGTAD